MASYTTITDLYDAYAALFGSEKPAWTIDELRDWRQRTGKRYEEITDADLDAAYEESIADADAEAANA